MRERCRVSTRLPTAASMRLTWWYLPSVSVRRRCKRPHRLAGGRAHRLRVVIEHHAGEKTGHLRIVDRMLGADLVDLRHVVLGRAHAVDELAVVGEEQQAGGVLVEPADGLDALHRTLVGAQAQWRGQQRVDAGIGRRLLRAFGACRLVQHQVGLLVVGPLGALDREAQVFRLELRGRVGDDGPRHSHQPLLNQPGADAPGAEALGVEDFLDPHQYPSARPVLRRGSLAP